MGSYLGKVCLDIRICQANSQWDSHLLTPKSRIRASTDVPVTVCVMCSQGWESAFPDWLLTLRVESVRKQGTPLLVLSGTLLWLLYNSAFCYSACLSNKILSSEYLIPL